jgi:hypothetical protein
MKKMIIAGGLAAIAAGVGIAFAGSAHADSTLDDALAPLYGGGHEGDQDAYAYWNQLDQLGHGMTPQSSEKFAHQACDALARGMSEGQAINIMEQAGLPGYIARPALSGAEFHFCPAYFN